MTMNIKCLHCGKALLVAEQHLGKQLKCPGCNQILQIQAKRPAPAPRLIVQEEPLLASLVEESSQSRNKKDAWLIGAGVLGSIFAFSALYVASVFAPANADPGVNKSTSPLPLLSARATPLLPAYADGWMSGNTLAYFGPSEDSGVVGKLNGGAAVTVISDDGSGWIELWGFGAPTYKGDWDRWPDNSQYVDNKKNIYIRKKYFTRKNPRL